MAKRPRDPLISWDYCALAACRILLLSSIKQPPPEQETLRTALDLATLAVSLAEEKDEST